MHFVFIEYFNMVTTEYVFLFVRDGATLDLVLLTSKKKVLVSAIKLKITYWYSVKQSSFSDVVSSSEVHPFVLRGSKSFFRNSPPPCHIGVQAFRCY